MSQYKKDKDFLKNSYNVKSVSRGVKYWQTYLLSRCQNIILFDGLPETVPAWELLKRLIILGNATFVKKKGKIYVPFTGNVYGFDEYYVPNKFTYAQPIIGSDSNLIDGKNCAIVWLSEVDKMGGSILWDTICRYARMLADLESTFMNNLIYSRTSLVGQASNQTAAIALDTMLSKLQTGDMSTIVNKTMPLDSLKIEQFTPINSYSWFCEMRDYLINCFYNDIGLQTLEEKKERMVVGEITADADILQNNIDIMYESICKGIEKANRVFNLNITVRKNEITEPEIEADIDEKPEELENNEDYEDNKKDGEE